MEYSEFDIENVKIKILQIQKFKNRPTIVFLHDSLGCIDLWRDFPAKLGELTCCNILVYDRQGYGKSSPFSNTKRNNLYLENEADVLNKLLNKCTIDNAILFGHSDGGSISLIMAAKYPTKISAIITEGAHVFVEEITLKGIKDAVNIYNTTNLKEKLEKYHGNKTDVMFWAWAKTWQMDEFSGFSLEPFLSNILCPSLIIQGNNDEYGSVKQVDAIVNQTTGVSEKFMLPNVGHTPHKEAADIVLNKSADFINDLLLHKI